MNFRKSSEGGGGHFQSKNLYCKIWTFEQGFFGIKMIQRGIFRVCFFNNLKRNLKKKVFLGHPSLQQQSTCENCENFDNSQLTLFEMSV